MTFSIIRRKKTINQKRVEERAEWGVKSSPSSPAPLPQP